MIRGFIVSTLLVVTLAGCGADTDSSDPATDNNEHSVGSPAVWARIENGTNCTALQREFDIAMDNAEARESGDPFRDLSLMYANAANDRMKEIDCYDD